MKDCENCRNNRTNSRCFYCVIKSNGEPSEWCPDMEDILRRYCENDVKALMPVMLNTLMDICQDRKRYVKLKMLFSMIRLQLYSGTTVQRPL